MCCVGRYLQCVIVNGRVVSESITVLLMRHSKVFLWETSKFSCGGNWLLMCYMHMKLKQSLYWVYQGTGSEI